MKPEVRIVAWDDCAFRFGQKTVRLVGVVFRGSSVIDGMLSTRITKDGTDATTKIAACIVRSRHYDQLSYIMLDGISFGGLNIADIGLLHRTTKLPVIAVQRKMPNRRTFDEALHSFRDYPARAAAVRSAGKIFRCLLGEKELFYQKSGIGIAECEALLRLTCVRSAVPEPLRVAHLVASGMSGESRGGA
ncbi:MAG: DUF99 family protein [Candidatus Aenigmarchaeota archaeon]|nr:DUF99 family protein [Candidatus Aenigmarchaeota archaeon]